MKDKLTPSDKVALRAKIELQVKVCQRAEKEGYSKNRMSLMMDLDSCELDLEKLLTAPPFGFAHDICGIIRNMDRTTYPGKLNNCFLPRCWKSEALAVVS